MSKEIITSLNLTDSASLRIKNVISNNEDSAAKCGAKEDEEMSIVGYVKKIRELRGELNASK